MNKYIVTLTSEEQEQLRHIITTRSSTSVIVKRAFVLLSVDTKAVIPRLSDEQICRHYQVGQRTIERLRRRFVEAGFDLTLFGKKQTRFKDKTFAGRVEAQLIALRCSDAPGGYQRWSLRLLAETLAENGEVASISHESVRQILKKTNERRGR